MPGWLANALPAGLRRLGVIVAVLWGAATITFVAVKGPKGMQADQVQVA